MDFAEARPVALAPADDGRSITLSVHEAGEGPAVVFCHGFPDIAFGWRHQVPVIAAAGFRAIAVDQRGYGSSSAPTEFADGMQDRITTLTRHDLTGVGHWIQQEVPEVVNRHLIDWLGRHAA